MSRSRWTKTALVALVATSVAACTSSGDPHASSTPSPVPVKIAVLQDLSIDEAPQLVTPTLLGLELALTQASDRGGLPVAPEVVGLDTQGDPDRAAELVGDVVADPSYVAVVIAPFGAEPVDIGDRLAAAGLPTLSLSGLDPSLGANGWRTWRRLVPTLPREAASMASAIHGSSASAGGVCLAGDGSAYANQLTTALRANLGTAAPVAELSLASASDLTVTVSKVTRAGCDLVAWTGSAAGATLLRTGLTEAGLSRVQLIGSAAAKTDEYLSATAGAGDGTVVTCGCVDLGSSVRPEAQRFIHDYQSEFGSVPGVFGAEAFDAGGMLARAFASGATTRRDVVAGLEAITTYRGLANTYRFAPNGELARADERIETFRAEGLRWVPLGGADVEPTLPVGTTGYLSVASCRKGRPFAYLQNGRLRGFDVELAAAIARRLGLRVAWSDRTCEAGLRAVSAGTLDALLAPTAAIAQGTPTSRVALALRVSLVATKASARGPEPFLRHLGPGDVVGVVRSPEAVTWAKASVAATGASFVVLGDRQKAYADLVTGRYAAVVDLEPNAWAAIEHRPSLVVAQGIDVGAHDVVVAKGPDATLVAAIDDALGRLIGGGRYGLLFAKYFPGTPIPPATGT